ncbi:MAG: carbon dioxide concentrating mechanism protein CcmL [Planctomycetota bacterium]|nr:MAG: carbon dioxide concentrating mechanism protein CcmL [Planctomycetota bacterium]
MRIVRVIGKLTLSRAHPSVVGARWLIAVPLHLEDVAGAAAAGDESLVVYDELAAGEGMLLAVSEGAEASAPFHPDSKPLDAYAAAILDRVWLRPEDFPPA